jgi:hypothetical protein
VFTGIGPGRILILLYTLPIVVVLPGCARGSRSLPDLEHRELEPIVRQKALV